MKSKETHPLHSGWRFREAGRKEWLPASVPGCVHTDLLAAGKIPDPFHGRNESALEWIELRDWEYELIFDRPPAFEAFRQVDLVAEGLDTVAAVTLNGHELGSVCNMFRIHRFAVGNLLKSRGNRLRITFRSPRAAIQAIDPKPEIWGNDPIGGRHLLRKEQCSFGWDWGPRFATSGIWRTIRLEGWSANRISDFVVRQNHQPGRAEIIVEAETTRRGKAFSVEASLRCGSRELVSVSAPAGQPLSMSLQNPALWWPHGLGAQPVHELTLRLLEVGHEIDRRSHRFAVCAITLEQNPDAWGRSFQFAINGRPFFAKGANWIPAHSFVNEGRSLLPGLLDSAVAAHMNMLRVWGGGVYEDDAFYHGCLERGLVVWQDFMFACAHYPADRSFLAEVKAEAEDQVRRLRNHAHLALWCGNNEIEQFYNLGRYKNRPEQRREYKKLFRELLPSVLARLSPGTAYISSSAHNADDPDGDAQNAESGDAHFWDVWHRRKPIRAYEEQTHRFFSEFGMQAYPHVETARTFTESSDLFGPDMDAHQKNGGGNQIIFHYIAELYRFPKDYPSAVYLSQMMQAEAIRCGVEHMRRNRPRTMGALYWQLNDCWPVASWSSIDFGGRWKALHYAARRFFAPALVSLKLIGSERMFGGANRVISSVEGWEVHTVHDGDKPCSGRIRWQLWSVSTNQIVASGAFSAGLAPDSARLQKELRFPKEIARFGWSDLLLRVHLESPTGRSEATGFLTAPKRFPFQPPKIRTTLRRGSTPGAWQIDFTTDTIAHGVYLNLADGFPHHFTDNFFDLFPGETQSVSLHTHQPINLQGLRKILRIRSYCDAHGI